MPELNPEDDPGHRYYNPDHGYDVDAALDVITVARIGPDTAEAVTIVEAGIRLRGWEVMLWSAAAVLQGVDRAVGPGRGPLSVEWGRFEHGRNLLAAEVAGLARVVGDGREADYRAVIRLATASEFDHPDLILTLCAMVRDACHQVDYPATAFDNLRDLFMDEYLTGLQKRWADDEPQ